MMPSRDLCLVSVLALAVMLPAPAALAQTDDPVVEEAVPNVIEEAVPKKKAKDTSDLEARVQQLERQILDMQVVIGTLESMSRGGGGSNAGLGSSAGLGSDAEARIAALEIQLQALAAEVKSLGGAAVSSAPQPLSSASDAGDFAATMPGDIAEGASNLTLGDRDVATGSDAIGDILQNSGTGDDSISLGSVDTSSATAGDGTASGSSDIASSDLGTLDGAEAAPSTGETEVASAPAASTPEQVYEEAYGHLLQQDYEAAESGFKVFLKQYPRSKLAGNAQYWLGETHYVRGNYKEAADAFLTGYKTFRKGQKAPDSLMKLAMSLSRLGEKDAACSAFAALENDFPKMQAQLRRRAESERQRAGC
jgi:tol-pal system protein YbgF